MTIEHEQTFVDGVTVLTADFLNLFQEIMAAYVSPNFAVEVASSTQVRVQAGPGEDSVAIVVDGEMRRRTTDTIETISGAAGVVDVYVNADSADDEFVLSDTEGTSSRKVAEVDWSGTAILGVRNLVGAHRSHATEHRSSGVDPVPGAIPVGGMVDFAGNAPPTEDWLMCHGQAEERDEYPELFDAIGTIWGPGNGSTTFNVPDFRGRFRLGRSTGGTGSLVGETGGELDHRHSGPSHAHSNPNVNSNGSHIHSMPGHSHSVNPPNTNTSVDTHNHGNTNTPNLIQSTTNITSAKHNVAAYNHRHSTSNDSHQHSVNIGSFNTSNVDPGNTHSNGSHVHSQGNTGASGTGQTGGGNPAYGTVNVLIRAR